MGYREIGYGEGDMEILRDLAKKNSMAKGQLELKSTEPPVAECVYVCSWCFRIVERVDLNWVDGEGKCVCGGCADEYFASLN